ncbi:MAG: tetratricopeptide repeat protein, partial [Proteobacteria bacterium]|nr:tetratricopeptide repeat protein [Pseudomonadota bacterium]
ADHPRLAGTLTNLAWVAFDKGDHRQAEELHLRALAIRRAALGPAHPTVAASLTDLAAVYTAEEDYAKAEQLLKDAVTIREEALGPDDPNLGQSLSNLGAVYSAQGRFDEAEALFERTLTIIEKSLGPGLPKSTAMSRVLYRLADVMHRTGRDTQAAERESRAGAIEAAAGLEPGSLRP